MSLPNFPERFALISDVHLRDPKDALTEKFLKTLRNLPAEHNVQALFLNGDIFDFIEVASPFFLKFWGPVFEVCKNLKQQGVAVYFSEGNHDFGFEHFPSKTLNESFTHYGDVSFSFQHPSLGRCWVQHADDIVCPPSYLPFRKFVKSRSFQKAISIVPGFAMQFVFTRYAKFSRSQDEYRPCPEEFLNKCLSDFFANQDEKIDTFFMGHIHQNLDFKHKSTRVFCGPSWLTEPNVLVCGLETCQKVKVD
jgi:UDP-2,3-diacylglucosamine pyrophosphatase LpxH